MMSLPPRIAPLVSTHPYVIPLEGKMIGQTISHYKILEKLGGGGMGVVYKAEDTKLKRTIALKFLPPDLTEDLEAKNRFVREARAASALDHPNICTIYEVDETADGKLFIAMACYEGEALTAKISRGPLPLVDAVDIGLQIASGLAAAHRKNVVHRDLKTANVFVTSEGFVKILDFGLAKLSGVTQLTKPETTLGTVSYMSPEQAQGTEVDTRSDIWSLGVVLYEMVTGQLPFRGEFAEAVVYSILNEAPTPISGLRTGVPLELERIVHKCLAKAPADRYQHLDDLVVDLNRLKPSLAAKSGLAAVEPRRGAWDRWRPWLPWVAGSGWLAAAVLLCVLLFRVPTPQEPVRLQSVTFSGRDWAPSASPAGDMIAFTSDRDGVSRIWLKQVAGGSEEPVTEGPDDIPRFSPDGSQILFVRERGGTRDLYRTPVVGGQPRRIMEDLLEADWSPDGMTPLGEDNLIVIGAADVQTGDERILAEIHNRLGYGIRWSPDGRRLAVSEASLTTAAAELTYIDLIDVASGELERLTITDWPGPYTVLHWGPDGRTFVVGQAPVVFTQVGHFPVQVMQYDLESKSRRELFWSPLKLPHGGRSSSTIAVLGADRIVVDEQSVRSTLYEVDWTPGGNPGPRRVLTRGLGRDRQPGYSPGGNRIIFSSNRSGNVDLWAVDLRERDLLQLTDDLAIDYDPAYTPDGGHFVWTSNRSGNMEIWMADADGGRARQLTNDGVDAENPTMTPNGQWVVYGSTNDEKMGIWKIRPDGTDATRLAGGTGIIPEVSPDSRYAAFTRNRGIGFVIKVVEIESGETVPFEIELFRKKIHENVVVGRARWTPDGGRVVFVGQNDEGLTGIYVQDFIPGRDTSDSRRPVAGFSNDFATESFGVSPDGARIVISAMMEQRSLKLAENVSLVGWE
jgi:Tol biopolymer transport system component/tRNA A-37 threonylcarbamoyl transferase component Bud32